jgi:hypothetical protein
MSKAAAHPVCRIWRNRSGRATNHITVTFMPALAVLSSCKVLSGVLRHLSRAAAAILALSVSGVGTCIGIPIRLFS